MTQSQPPCAGRDEWTRESNKGQGEKSEAAKAADYDASLRAKMTCLLMCDRRRECLGPELERPISDQWYIYGGYTGAERMSILSGTMRKPASVTSRNLGTSELLDFIGGDSIQEVADRAGIEWGTLDGKLRGLMWEMREDEGDLDLFADLFTFCARRDASVPAA